MMPYEYIAYIDEAEILELIVFGRLTLLVVQTGVPSKPPS